MKAGIFSPYLDTLGGGERYVLTAAEYLLKLGWEVDILGEKSVGINEMAARFGLNLSGAKFNSNPFSEEYGLIRRILKTREYDLILVLSDGSIPLSFAGRNLLHFQVPFQRSNRSKIINQLKLQCYSAVICNSFFTKKVIDSSYGTTSEVLYPPVDVENFKMGKKEKIILSVGRFFAPSHIKNFAPKKQSEMIGAFRTLVETGLKDWQLVLIGSADKEGLKQVEKLKKESGSLPVKIIPNVPYDILRNYFSRATIYWHAAGYGEDLTSYPERAEHFGITTVEAMAAGCVPVVFSGGGQREIVEDNVSGLFWKTTQELQDKTSLVVSDIGLQKSISTAAVKRSKNYSKERFQEAFKLLANA